MQVLCERAKTAFKAAAATHTDTDGQMDPDIFVKDSSTVQWLTVDVCRLHEIKPPSNCFLAVLDCKMVSYNI